VSESPQAGLLPAH